MATRKFKIKIEGKIYEAEVEEIGVEAGATPTFHPSSQKGNTPPQAKPVAAPGGSGKSVIAPMPGKILSVKVSKGQNVNAGDTVVILEAMKMEQEIKSTQGGTIIDIPVKEGETVTKNQPLVVFG
jgi:glutaconyl-CoA/methylmalonyl-CoA decarboxylase subunit gamma